MSLGVCTLSKRVIRLRALILIAFATVLPTSEKTIAGPLTFHKLALIIAAASTLFAILMSFYLIVQHGRNYTKPREQKQYGTADTDGWQSELT
jgi:hypothetical protein